MAKGFVSLGNQTGEGWFLTGEMLELIHSGVKNIVCTQPFGCLPNHIVGKGVIKELRRNYPDSNIIAVDYDPGASEVNQLNRIKLMLATAHKNLKKRLEPKVHGCKIKEDLAAPDGYGRILLFSFCMLIFYFTLSYSGYLSQSFATSALIYSFLFSKSVAVSQIHSAMLFPCPLPLNLWW